MADDSFPFFSPLLWSAQIYNHKELRAGLPANTQFMTDSDCECVMHLFEQNQDDPTVFLNQLNGIFAFVLNDERNDRFIAARDHMGIIPLYMGRDADGAIWFASELKALSDICVTFEEFPPGHYYDSRTGTTAAWYRPKWHDETFVPTAPLDLEKLRDGLISAVKRQLMSDGTYTRRTECTGTTSAEEMAHSHLIARTSDAPISSVIMSAASGARRDARVVPRWSMHGNTNASRNACAFLT